MRNRIVFELVLLAVLGWTLIELLLRQHLDRLPEAFHLPGIILAVASTPWSLLALEFFRGVDSLAGQIGRDFAFIMVIALGTAFNAVLLNSARMWIIGVLHRR
jgi:hypothetical protein